MCHFSFHKRFLVDINVSLLNPGEALLLREVSGVCCEHGERMPGVHVSPPLFLSLTEHFNLVIKDCYS